MTSSASAGGKEQPLIQHLLELRSRIIRSTVVIFMVFAGLFYFSSDIYEFISEPLRVYLPEGTSMIATDVASPFLAPFKLTLVLSLFISVPYILHQIWAFISPGLYKHEKRLAVPLLVASVVLFLFRYGVCLLRCFSAGVWILYQYWSGKRSGDDRH